MRIDHIGYAVRNIDKAIISFEKIGYEFEPIIDDVDRNVKLAFGSKDGYRMELVSPLDRNQVSPVDQYVSRAYGIPYHICYESEEFDNDVENLKSQGLKVIIEPRPAVAFDGRRVIFFMNRGFGLMEIVEGNKRL